MPDRRPDRLDYDALFRGVDRPRDLPPDLADRLAATLAPTAVPRSLRRRIERVLVPALPTWRRPVVLAAAAAILVLLATAVPLVNRGDTGDDGQRLQATGATTTSTLLRSATAPSTQVGNAEVSAGAIVGAEPASGASASKSPTRAASSSGSMAKRYPPFTIRSDDAYPTRQTSGSPQAASAESSAGDSEQRSATATFSPASGPVVRIGIVGGDPAQERGFRGYVEVANGAGGLDGRRIELVPSGTSSPAAGVLVTVNLSDAQLPSWRGGPLVETLNATESVMRGDTFGLAGSAERQARLAVDSAFPSLSPGATAVIYTGGAGAWTTTVPDAMESVLRSRAVSVSRVAVETDRPIVLAPADAAFLSLDPKRVLRFGEVAADGDYRPGLGVWGIWSTYIDGTRMPEGARALSPWQPPTSNEARALAEYAPGPRSAALLHGWAVAKSVATAIDRRHANTPAETADGLRHLPGFDPFLAPPYQYRSNTTCRTPDARLFELAGTAFTARGEWRRDPR